MTTLVKLQHPISNDMLEWLYGTFKETVDWQLDPVYYEWDDGTKSSDIIRDDIEFAEASHATLFTLRWAEYLL